MRGAYAGGLVGLGRSVSSNLGDLRAPASLKPEVALSGNTVERAL